MLKGKTKSGFAFEISDDALNNYELLDIISEVDTNPLLVPKLINMLLGADQKKALIDHVRDDKGMVPTSAVSAELADIFQANKVKN